MGLNQLILMTYISEICPSQSRGAMLGTYSIWASFVLAFANWAQWGIGKFLASISLKILSGESPDIWRRWVPDESTLTN